MGLPVSFDAGPQPAGREPAPGELGLVQAFVNVGLGDETTEPEWEGPEDVARWLRARGLLARGTGVTAADFRRAMAVREGIRAMLLANNKGGTDDKALAALRRAVPSPELRIAYYHDGTAEVVASEATLDGALELIVGLVYEAIHDETWERFKACRDEECRWAFYDYSRNQASAWCSMDLCGARDKVRNYRRRQRGGSEQKQRSDARRGRAR